MKRSRQAAIRHVHDDSVRNTLHARGRDTGMDLESFGTQISLQGIGNCLVLERQEAGHPLEDDDLHPDPRKGLRELQPDGAAAQHEHRGGQLLQLHRGRAIQGAGLFESGNCGHRRPSARGDDDLARAIGA